MTFFVYLLECTDKSYYCGYTKDLSKRLNAHNKGTASKYTRGRQPLKLVYSESKKNLKQAMKREREIKSYTKKQKQELTRKKG